MQGGRTQARKSNFDLNRFYENLNRIENSLGKSGSRANSNTTNKNSRFRTSEDERQRNLANFKKELHNKGLIKGKIKLDQPYERIKVTQADVPETFKMPEQPPKKMEEDPYERVRNKLLSWKSEQKKKNQTVEKNENQISSITNTSNLLQQNKENLEFSLEKLENNQIQKSPLTEDLTSQLVTELTLRNEVYCEIEKGLGKEESSFRKKNEDLSLRMQNHFREHSTMMKVIQKFKQLCGLQASNLEELLSFLKSGQNQGDLSEGESRSDALFD